MLSEAVKEILELWDAGAFKLRDPFFDTQSLPAIQKLREAYISELGRDSRPIRMEPERRESA